VYNGIIMMKNVKKPQIRKVRNRLHQDEIYYTYTNWETKEIDGVQFIPVVKQPQEQKLQQIHYMKKDNMEFIK
jgi:hypothetical protein